MNLQFIVSPQTEPYLNLALENHLLAHTGPDTVVLYLWRNRRTVVIGQNQNPFSEVNLEVLLADGGYLMRRRTGGGAVYHDDGNLNFSFVVPKALYALDRQFSVVCRAVESFGLATMRSGRNDLLVDCRAASLADGPALPSAPDWRKFSGNAFSRGSSHDLHHGTLLVSGNMADLQRYLRPKPSKLLKHGVSSVRSRVANLALLNPAVSTASLEQPLFDAFAAVYGQQPRRVPFEPLAADADVQRLRARFASDDWLYGPWRSFSAKRSGSFAWGEVDIALSVGSGSIADVQIATDALDLDAVEQARRRLLGASTAEAPTPANQIEADLFSLVYA